METSSTEAIERLFCATPLYMPWDGPTPPKPNHLSPGTSRWVALASCWVHRRGVMAGWRGLEETQGWQTLYDILLAGGWDEQDATGAIALLARLDRLAEALGALRGVSEHDRAALWHAAVGADLRKQLKVTGALLLIGPDAQTWQASEALAQGAWLPLDLRRGKQAPLQIEHIWPPAMHEPRLELFGARKGSTQGGEKGLMGALGRAGEWGVVCARELHRLPDAEQDALAWALERERYLPLGDDRPTPTPALLIATARAEPGAALSPALSARLARLTLGGEQPDAPVSSAQDAGPLQETLAAMVRGEAQAREILTAYCKHLYAKLGTYEAVALASGLDRRTVKKHVEGN